MWKASEWIQCDICDEWWCKGCTGLNDDEREEVAGTELEFVFAKRVGEGRNSYV